MNALPNASAIELSGSRTDALSTLAGAARSYLRINLVKWMSVLAMRFRFMASVWSACFVAGSAFSTPLATTDLANSLAVCGNAQVIAVERMPVNAVSLGGMSRSHIVAAEDIDSHRYWFQVCWINTERVAAEVIECQTVRHNADDLFVGPPPSTNCFTTSLEKAVKTTVSFLIPSSPNPARTAVRHVGWNLPILVYFKPDLLVS